ncbi:hypothetical protein SCHPADRAFT_928080 [Schizopora paradoxa]|uniref:Uncharacterized protein n=1 Tax=Schizopora paradoxa TaxID=27342 RepID=A0A0H2RXD5_9AGAM|nr:hypothetical protein SCHPADRAFT_928080 [Schizopora paradoxa]
MFEKTCHLLALLQVKASVVVIELWLPASASYVHDQGCSVFAATTNHDHLLRSRSTMATRNVDGVYQCPASVVVRKFVVGESRAMSVQLGSVAQAIADYLSPDDLVKVSAFRRKLEKEKAFKDEMHAVDSQSRKAQNVISGKQTIHRARKSPVESRENFASRFERLCDFVKTVEVYFSALCSSCNVIPLCKEVYPSDIGKMIRIAEIEGEEGEKDFSEIFQFFGILNLTKELEAGFDVIELVLAFFEASKDLAFLSFRVDEGVRRS